MSIVTSRLGRTCSWGGTPHTRRSIGRHLSQACSPFGRRGSVGRLLSRAKPLRRPTHSVAARCPAVSWCRRRAPRCTNPALTSAHRSGTLGTKRLDRMEIRLPGWLWGWSIRWWGDGRASGGSNLSYPHVGALTGPLLTSVVASLTVALGLSSVIGLAGGVVLCLFVDETLSVTVDSHQGSERESRDAR